MFIKLTLICLAIVPLIIGEESENPVPSAPTRVGKFFGLFSGIAVGFEQHLDFPNKPHNPSGSLENLLQQFDVVESNNSATTNATSTSGIDDAVSTEATALDSTTETMQATSRTLKLEDYDEITFDPDVDGNRVSREATWIVSNGNNGLRAGEDDAAADSTTTVESTTMTMKLQDQETLESNFVTMSPPPSSQQGSNYASPHDYFPYPPSKNPAAQHVTITTSPLHPPYLPPMKNYYDFYPSQLDYFRHPMPFCINPVHHKFTPVVHDTWSNYRKWK